MSTTHNRERAIFSFYELANNPAVRENANYAHDSDQSVVVDARPHTPADRNRVEGRLILEGIFYDDVIYA